MKVGISNFHFLQPLMYYSYSVLSFLLMKCSTASKGWIGSYDRKEQILKPSGTHYTDWISSLDILFDLKIIT